MRKLTLKEQLERIHTITYGKKVISEAGFLDKVLDFADFHKKDLPKVDDPKKADYVSDNVKDFFGTLEEIDRPLFQQREGSMTYQKEIESVQIGLILLGYQLPQYGVDGLFGPETASAVEKFKKDNQVKESINEAALEAPIPISKVTQPFGVSNGHESSHPGVDLRAMSGTEVKSPGDGVITNAEFSNSACGGTVSIKHDDHFQSRYCHLREIRVTNGQQVKQGDIIGISGGNSGDKGAGNSRNAHLHFELKKDGQLVDPLDYIGANGINFTSSQPQGITKSIITPEMVDVLINKLKERTVKPEELDKLIDTVKSGGSTTFSDFDLTTGEGYKNYALVCQKFIETRNPSAGISGEMLAYGARMAFEQYHKYVPPELALAQLTVEGGLSKNPNDKPIRTKNPFNVGNTESGTKEFPTIQEAINTYYILIARDYLGRGKTAADLVNNFVNKNNQRYAAENNYESELNKVASQVSQISGRVVNKPSTNV